MPRRLLFAFALATVAPAALVAQAASVDSATLRTARTLIEVTRAADNFVTVFEKALESEMASGGGQLPPLFLDRFKAAVRADLPRLLEELALIHARTYTRAEMEGAIAFFRSPAGQQYAAKQATISVASAEMGKRWGGALAMRVMSEMIEKGEYTPPGR